MEQVFNEIVRRAKKTKNIRVRRALERKLPVLHETVKTAMIIKGVKVNPLVKEFLQDITAIKKPFCKLFMKKNDIVPFDRTGMDSLEFLSRKNECSLFLFGQSLKKRPNSVVFGRFFTYQLTDMIELSIEAYSPIVEFAANVKTKPQFGTHILLNFNGDLFESDPKFRMAQSVFLDFFRGPQQEELCLSASSLIISFFSIPPPPGEEKAKLVMKCYTVANEQTLEDSISNGMVPPLSLQEIGPSAVFTIERVFQGPPTLINESFKTPITHFTRNKNILHSVIPGMKEAKINVQKQDLTHLSNSIKKSAALKRAEAIAKQKKAEGEEEKEEKVEQAESGEEMGSEEMSEGDEEGEEFDDDDDEEDDEDDEDEDEDESGEEFFDYDEEDEEEDENDEEND